MKTGIAFAYLLLWAGTASGAGPTVTSVVNAGSTVSGPVAPGEIIIIFGSGFAASPAQAGSPVPTSLEGVSVTIDGTALGLLFVSGGQVNAISPAQLQPTSGHQLVVTVDSASSSPFEITGAIAAPGIFTASSLTQADAINSDGTVNSPSNPAAPGSSITVFFTGGGQTNPAFVDYANPSSQAKLAQTVVVGLNNTGVPFSYAGLEPNQIGFDEVIIQIPQSTASGNVPISIGVMGQSGFVFSQGSVTVAIGTGTGHGVTGLTIVSGNNQSTPTGRAFPLPLVVRAGDSQGNSVSGVSITWTVTSGAAVIGTATVVTDANGQAATTVTAGAVAGPIVITASVGGFFSLAVTFNLVAASSCKPTALAVEVTSLGNGATVPMGFPILISVNVLDDCGNPVTSGTVVASFSDGDPTIALTSVGKGNWSGTWVPTNVASQIVLTISAFLPQPGGNALAGQTQVTLGTTSTGPTPVIGAVTDGASFQHTLSPGAFVTIFGSNLTSSISEASFLPLPTSLGGTTVFVGGTVLPLFYASPTQINALLPYTLPINSSVQILIQNGLVFSAPVSIDMSAVSPGVFAYGQNQGVVLTPGFALISPSNPAVRGDIVVVFCSGLGATNPAVVAGAATSQAATTVNPVSVTIGGVAAQVVFAGLAPGFAGLYQVNLLVPSGAPVGSKIPLIIRVEGISSAAVNMAVK
jgi:uncharacterized protein (TIGR03437 family)